MITGDNMVCNGEMLIKIECNANEEENLVVYEDSGGISIVLELEEAMLPYICLTDEDVLRLVDVLADYCFRAAIKEG